MRSIILRRAGKHIICRVRTRDDFVSMCCACHSGEHYAVTRVELSADRRGRRSVGAGPLSGGVVGGAGLGPLLTVQ